VPYICREVAKLRKVKFNDGMKMVIKQALICGLIASSLMCLPIVVYLSMSK